MSDWRGTVWLDCPNCEDGQVKVKAEAHEGEKPIYYPSDAAYPGSNDYAEIVDLLDHSPSPEAGGCKLTDITDAQLDHLEGEEQVRLLEATDVPNEPEYDPVRDGDW